MSDIERRAYERVTSLIKTQPLRTVSPILALLARRYSEASQDFVDKYDSMTRTDEGYNFLEDDRRITKLSRLVTYTELTRSPMKKHEDIHFEPLLHRYEEEPKWVNEQLMQFRRSKAKYLIMPIHNGLHYVTMVVTKFVEERPEQADIYEEYKTEARNKVRLHASVLESLSGDHERLNGFLRKLHVDSCTLNAGTLQQGETFIEIADLQNMAHGCGIFSTLLYDHLLKSVNQAPDQVVGSDQVVKGFINDFTALTPEDKRQINLFRRLQLLDSTIRRPETQPEIVKPLV